MCILYSYRLLTGTICSPAFATMSSANKASPSNILLPQFRCPFDPKWHWSSADVCPGVSPLSLSLVNSRGIIHCKTFLKDVGNTVLNMYIQKYCIVNVHIQLPAGGGDILWCRKGIQQTGQPHHTAAAGVATESKQVGNMFCNLQYHFEFV